MPFFTISVGRVEIYPTGNQAHVSNVAQDEVPRPLKKQAHKVGENENKNVLGMIGRNPMPIPSPKPRSMPETRAKAAPKPKADPGKKRMQSDTSI